MTTMQDLISETKGMTYGTLGDQLNVIAAPYVASAQSIIMELDVTGISYGMMISSGLNVWYVKGVDTGTKTVYVIPGYNNSPKQAAAIGDFVYIKPRVTDWYLFETLNQEIIRLSNPDSGLYKVGSWEAPANFSYETYPVPTEAQDMVGILRVRYRFPGSTDTWFDVSNKSYRIQLNSPTAAELASGLPVARSVVRLLISVPGGAVLQFQYKAPFVKASLLSDDIETVCGLASTMVDIPPLGAYKTLLYTTESRRNQVQEQGDPRRAAEVGQNSNTATSRFVSASYNTRVNEEATRLIQRIPYVRSL